MPVKSKLLSLLSSSLHLRHLTVLPLSRYARHPISPFTSTEASHGRRHIPSPNFPFSPKTANLFHAEATVNEESGSNSSNSWPEWSKLSSLLVEKGYSDGGVSCGEDDDDSLLGDGELPEEFLKSVKACLGFARDRPDILRLLTKKNIEAVVLSGSPFLFKNGENSSRRFALFFNGEGNNGLADVRLAVSGDSGAHQMFGISEELELEKAETVDVMRYLLSYIYGSLSSSDVNVPKSDELVEKSVRKLLCELCNLSGTVWKSKSVDASLTELPLSNEQGSRSSGQDTEMRNIESSYTTFVAPSFIASQSQSSGPSNFVNSEYRIFPVNRIQGPEEAPVDRTFGGYNNNPSSMNMNHSSSLNTLRSNFDANAAESSSSFRTFNPNSAESTTDLSQPPSHFGNNYNGTYNGEYNGKPNQQSGNSWSNSNTSYDGSTPNSFTPHEKSQSAQHPYGSIYNANSPPQSSNSSSTSSSTTLYATPNSFTPPEKSWSAQHPYGSSYTANSPPQSGNSSSTSSSTTLYGGSMTSSSQSPPPPGNYWNNHHSLYHREGINSTAPSNSSLRNNTSSFFPTSGASQPLSNSWDNHSNPTPPSSGATWSNDNATISSQSAHDQWSGYNASYPGNTTNSTPPSSNSWDNNSRSNYQSNYNTQSDGFVTKPTQTSSNSGNSGYTPYHGFRENSTQLSGNLSNSGNRSFGPSSGENSPQPLPDSWNNSTAFSSQQPSNSTSYYNTSPKISVEPVQNPRNTNNSYPGSIQDTYRGYADNLTHPSNNSWNSHPTTYSGGPTSTPAQPSDRNSWNPASESSSSGFPQVNSQKNASYGYPAKSLEGSCVTEPDPLDMSEEAKAERWFRRAAQIKDISELSQIPDEDFPQIMPMRKGVNRFVVSKRKTPLERRLATQQYRRNLPVVSSESWKEPTVGESTANDGSDSSL